jgi:uncharacterized membrane protein YidH (DUF202 family)
MPRTHNDDEQTISKRSHPRDHMANERTFLAWIRTSIGIMAFGFVVEKFALFTKQLPLLLGSSHTQVFANASPTLQGYSSIFGIFLVALGVLICLLAFVKYKKVEKQIEDNTYQPSLLINVMITLAVLLIGLFLVVYLKSGL